MKMKVEPARDVILFRDSYFPTFFQDRLFSVMNIAIDEMGSGSIMHTEHSLNFLCLVLNSSSC